MYSVWSSSFRVMVPQRRRHSCSSTHQSLRYWVLLHCKRPKLSFLLSSISSSGNGDTSASSSKQPHVGYDPSEELFGLDVDLHPRKVSSAASKPRSWFGPNGQYIRELPCPSCRGRGYTPCTECGIERPRPECSLCNGKSLNAKTGIFSKRMKIIHKDPILHAQRVAAIKKTKGAAAARKHASDTMKSYFSNPENRRKRSISMKGIKFYCKNCGVEGHRRNYCPELKNKGINTRFTCRLCGKKGHNRRTCPMSKLDEDKSTTHRNHLCKTCGKSGHNRRTCPLVTKPNEEKGMSRRDHHCKTCGKSGHNRRTCPQVTETKATIADGENVVASKKCYRCHVCWEKGHNKRTCPQRVK